MSTVFINKFVNESFVNQFFFEDCDLEDASLANKPIKFLKMFMFYYKIGLIKLPPIAKVMDNQNFTLGTMILCLQTY